jgi:hypothetical protein
LTGSNLTTASLTTTGGTNGNGGSVNVNSTGSLALSTIAANGGAGSTAGGNVTLTSTGAVTQSGSIAAAGLSLNGVGGSFVLRHASNTISTLAANTGDIDYAQSGALTVGTVGVSGVTTTGVAKVETTGAASNLTLANAVTSSASGDAIILRAGSSNAAGTASGGQIINNAGASGIVASSGRYLAYSGDPSTTLESVSGYDKRYNSAATYSPTGTASMFLYRVAPTLTISANSKTRVYGDANPTLDGSVTGLIDGDTAGNVNIAYTTSAVANTPVSSSPVTITPTATNNQNYTLALGNGSLTITQRPLTVSAVGQNRAYDGSTVASVSFTDNRVFGDTLTVTNSTASFADKNVGTGKTVSVGGISLTGASAANYSFNTTASTSADITARPLTVSASGQNRVYDGTTAATVTLGDNRISGDALTLASTSASFADKNVGTGKTVSVGGISLSGTDAANYSFNTTASTSADITARPLTVSATGQNRVYDGTTAATVTLGDNRISGDALTLASTSASFANKNVGTGKTVSVTGISLSGTDAANYSFNTTASTSADITARPLTVSASGQNRVYDGTTAATVTLGDNRISGDALTLASTSASFANKNVGTGKTVSVTGISLSGTDAANYSFNTTASTSADITARPLTVSASGQNRVYDGTTAATVTLGDNRIPVMC